MRRTEAELTKLVDSSFTSISQGSGTLIKSTVNGSSFEFAVPSMLSPMEIAGFALQALDHKQNGITAPITRTSARFYP